jgi:hypothetical protein
MTVRGESAVVPEVTCAEFEMWSHVCPGAMSAVNFYPGPLQDEQTWWLGIAPSGGSDQEPVEWQQSYHLFNPGDSPVKVTISLLGIDGDSAERTLQVELASGSVQRLVPSQFGEMPVGKSFAVVARGDAPFCAQTFVRTFTRGLSPVRAMYSHMGVPMSLTS